MRAPFCVLWGLALTLTLVCAFLCSGLLVINMTPRRNGMGNHLFRYAAGMGLVERGFQVCWSNYSWEGPAKHPHSFFLHHVHDPGCIPECSLFAGVLAHLVLPRYAPPFSKFVPFEGRLATLMDGEMESFRYFPTHAPAPLFRLKQRSAALRWMRARNLTSAVHVRRGDYVANAPPLAFYSRTNLSAAVVVTDDPDWVRQHPAVFGNLTLSESHDPGFDMALLSAATDTVVISVGTFGWWGAYLSHARRVIYYAKQAGGDSDGYVEADRMPPHWLSF
jgi:hypothetical protein